MFLVTCSSSSDCEPESDIKLFVYRNEIEGPVRHPDFTCQKKFEQGLWFVSCNGTVSKEAIVDFDKIGCRLHLKNQTEKEFFEKVIPKDVFLCGSSAVCKMKCTEEDQDRYFSDQKTCAVFHRCVNGTRYSSPCPATTFFSTKDCTCSHTEDMINRGSCNANGTRLKSDKEPLSCVYHSG
ncbi:uncharacterized protein LOC144619016 isoform X1 [Crassostrea virginica]